MPRMVDGLMVLPSNRLATRKNKRGVYHGETSRFIHESTQEHVGDTIIRIVIKTSKLERMQWEEELNGLRERKKMDMTTGKRMMATMEDTPTTYSGCRPERLWRETD